MSDILPLTRGLDRAMEMLETHRAVLALDQLGRIAAINQCYLRVTGFAREELVGAPVWRLFDLAERCAGRLGDLMELPADAILHLPDLAHRSRAGRRFRMDARLLGLRDGDGRPSLGLVFARPEEGGGLIDMRHLFGQTRRADPDAVQAGRPHVIRMAELRGRDGNLRH